MHEVEGRSFDSMIDPTDGDRLHQSDWSAQRIGQALCELIVNAATDRLHRKRGRAIARLRRPHMPGIRSACILDYLKAD